MAPSVVVEGGAVLLDVESFGYAPLEPACLLVENSNLVFRELVLVFLEVLTNMRWRLPMLSKSAVQCPGSFPHIVGITVVAFYMVHNSAFVLLVNLVLWVNKATPDGVGRSQVHRNSCFAYAPS